MLAKLGADLRADDSDIANREGTKRIIRLDDVKNGGRDTLHFGEVIEVRQNSVRIGIAIIENFFRKLLVAVTRVDGEE